MEAVPEKWLVQHQMSLKNLHSTIVWNMQAYKNKLRHKLKPTDHNAIRGEENHRIFTKMYVNVLFGVNFGLVQLMVHSSSEMQMAELSLSLKIVPT